MDMKELIRKRLGLAAGSGPVAADKAGEKKKNEGEGTDARLRESGSGSEGPREGEGGSDAEETEPQRVSVCDCGRCQEYVAAKRPPTTAARGRGNRGRGRGGPASAGRGAGNPWGGQTNHAGRLGAGRQPEDDDEEDEEGSTTTTCASCGCDIISHVVPGQLEDEDGFEDEDYDPVYGEHD